MNAAKIVMSAAIIVALSGCNSRGDTGNAGYDSAGADEALPDVEIISEEAAAAEAARTITEDNADAVFEAMEAELERELSDGGG